MSDKLADSIKKASFGFADDYLGAAPGPESKADEDDAGWFGIQAAAEIIRVDMLAFVLDANHYALPLADIATVVDERTVTPYPTVRAYMLGGIQHSNHIYPVVDLQRLLQTEAAETSMSTKVSARARAKIAIVTQAGRTVGFRIQHVRRAYRIPMDSLRTLPDSVRSANRHMIEAVFDADDKSFHVISVSSVFRALGDEV